MPNIPVILLTGFLGSGKTTLLNEMLRSPEFEDTALIINEFGEIALDHDLVVHDDDRLMVSSSGCICCQARSDLSTSLGEILCRMLTDEIPAPKRIIIETTGLADPIPIIGELLRIAERPVLRSKKLGAISFSLHTVVTLVSAVTGELDIEGHLEALKQAAVADAILISKADLAADPASRADLSRLKQSLMKINPACRLFDKQDGNFQPSMLLGQSAYDPGALSEDASAWLGAETFAILQHPGDHPHHPNRHGDRVHAHSFEFDEPITINALRAFLLRACRELGERLLRLKGIINMEDDRARPVTIHAVRSDHSPIVRLERWPSQVQRSRLVLIVQDEPEDTVGELVADLRAGCTRTAPRIWLTLATVASGMTALAVLITFLLHAITGSLVSAIG